MRTPPATAVTTNSDEFRPWEFKDGERQRVETPKVSVADANWGRVSYLAGGRLISPQEYQALLMANQAYDLIRSEKYSMAVEVLKKALAIYPDLASGQTNLGLALEQLGDNEAAVDHLREAIAIDPSRPAPWVNLASSFQLSGKLLESVATYSEFVRRFPEDPLNARAKEISAHLQKEVDEQLAVERTLTDRSGKDYFAFASRGGAVRWPSERSTIKVYIASADEVPGFKPEYSGFFIDSFKQWSGASENKIGFEFIKKPDGADIACAFTNDSSKVSSPAEGGETLVESVSKSIRHATITILTMGLSVDSPLSPNQVKAVCLHEIGHSIGLIGHSTKPTDIMYCSMPAANAKVGLSPRDTATIARLYSTDIAGLYLRERANGLIPSRTVASR
jgi:hypothetical protein